MLSCTVLNLEFRFKCDAVIPQEFDTINTKK